MAKALNTKTLPISKTILHMPDINEVVKVLSDGLKANFAEVSVDYVDCPDLSKEPFHLASSGLGGNPHLLDIGGVPYLLPLVNREKIYNLADMCKVLEVEPGFLLGAGAGPWPYLGVNCEGVINLRVENGKVDQQTRIASISPTTAEKGKGSCKLEILPQSETCSALLVNLLLSQGKPGKVLRVVCKKRTGTLDYIAAIRQCLADKYVNKSIGLGGAFVLKEGKSKNHIMPDFSKIALNSNADVEDWLHFFDMSAPMINLGTLVSHDPGLDLRLQHFHAFSQHGEGGHYHIDTTPDTAHYIGYFTLAEILVRVDRPPKTLDFGQD